MKTEVSALALGVILIGSALSAEEKRPSVEDAAKMFGNTSVMSNAKKKALVVGAFKGLQGAEARKAAEALAKLLPTIGTGPARAPFVQAVKNLGPDCAPVLLTVVGNDQAWNLISRSISGLGVAAVPAVIAALDGKDEKERYRAALLLTGLAQAADRGPQGAPVANALRELLTDPQRSMRVLAIQGLARLRKSGKGAAQEVAVLIKDGDAGLKRVAINALAAMGELGAVGDAALAAIVSDASATVLLRHAAAKGLIARKISRQVL